MSISAGGVTLQVDSDGRETGEAYVEFTKAEEAEKALYKDRQMIGHRCVHCIKQYYVMLCLLVYMYIIIRNAHSTFINCNKNKFKGYSIIIMYNLHLLIHVL